jgi:hypothetical protein
MNTLEQGPEPTPPFGLSLSKPPSDVAAYLS